jgi:hypothetical protein
VNTKSVFQLKREFEKIVDEKNPIMLQHRGDSSIWQDCYYCSPNTNQATTLQKRVQKLAKVQPELATLLMPIVDRLIAKQTEVEAAKVAEQKARDDRKTAAAAKRQERETVKRNPYHGLHPEVAKLLKEVAEPYRVKAVEMETERLEGVLNHFKEIAAKVGSFDPYVVFPYKKGSSYIENQTASGMRMQVDIFIYRADQYSAKSEWKLQSKTAEIIQARALAFGHDMVNAFVHKVGTKLSGIVEKKVLAETSISGSLQSHWMHFKFQDGSAFDVQSQIIWKTSINGVYFPQYPTCFRSVKMSNGQSMDTPSEAKMKEEFI